MSDDPLLSAMRKAIIDGDREAAARLAGESVSVGLDPVQVIENGYVPGIQEVGELWERGDYFRPELIASAEAMKATLAVLEPELARRRLHAPVAGRVVIGTIEGDIHDIGKNLVAAMLQAGGFEVFDLGADVKVERFIEEAESVKADLICASALLTTTMVNQKRLVDTLRTRGLRDKYTVLVGGAPASPKWAQDAGADGYAENAVAAVRLAKSLRQGGAS